MFDDLYFIKKAIGQALIAKEKDEVPIGCVIVKDGKILVRAHNKRETSQNAIYHAEILAIDKACKKLKSFRLNGCTLYVTCEPCAMCAGAIIMSRLDRVVYGASEEKFGCVESKANLFEKGLFNHEVKFEGGVLKEECLLLLKNFFKEKRKAGNKT